MPGLVEYLFNYLAHVHNSLTTRGAGASGILSYAQATELGYMVADVDSLPGSQAPSQAYWHSMCNTASAECASQMENYRAQQWAAKSPEGLARLLHLDQDSFAPQHSGGQFYDGFKSVGQLFSHIWSDTMPGAALQTELVQRSAIIIRSYDQNCGGCIYNWAAPPARSRLIR